VATIEGGGVSGAPLKARALEVLRRLHARAGHDLVLISVGGVETPEDAWQRILAGATLVQAYTGFVYGGPAWPRRMNRGLARRVRDAGKSSVQELVGAGPRDREAPLSVVP
jgi:dihydroorotate dehydrogenase